MTNGVILDGLLFIAILLYVPIGALRGGLREAVLGGAILLGGILAATRPESWADWAATSFDLSLADAKFLVAAGCLGGSALLLGYGGGALCDRRIPSWRGRILGAGLGGTNAILFIAFVLIAHERLARSNERGESVRASFAAEAMIDRLDLVVLAVAAVAAVGVAAGHVIHRLLGVPFDTDLEPALTWLQGTQRPARSIRIPAEADSGKVEPDLASRTTDSLTTVIRTSRRIRHVAPSVHDDVARRDSWGNDLWRDDIGFDARVPGLGRDDPMNPVERRRSNAPGGGAPAPDDGRAYNADLAELHRLLRIPSASHPDRRDGPSHELGRASNPRIEQPRSGGPPEPGRCSRCETLLPDPTLPCPFCDHPG